MEPLNAIDRELIRRALDAPEMQRFVPQVLAVCKKLGVPPPAWAVAKPAAGEPYGGS